MGVNECLGMRRISRTFLVVVSLALGITLVACSSTQINNTSALDRSQIETETTDFESRREYYHKHVDEYMDSLTEEEKDEYRVDLHVEYVGADKHPGDDLIFLRNDNTYKGDISNYSDFIELSPGIYNVISHEADVLGEIELLVPGEVLTLVVDYETKSVTIRTNT